MAAQHDQNRASASPCSGQTIARSAGRSACLALVVFRRTCGAALLSDPDRDGALAPPSREIAL
jgi:hypothetical protein